MPIHLSRYLSTYPVIHLSRYICCAFLNLWFLWPYRLHLRKTWLMRWETMMVNWATVRGLPLCLRLPSWLNWNLSFTAFIFFLQAEDTFPLGLITPCHVVLLRSTPLPIWGLSQWPLWHPHIHSFTQHCLMSLLNDDKTVCVDLKNYGLTAPVC